MYREIKEEELRIDYANKGYIYFNDINHPLNSGGKVYYHRHVASLMKGCWLNSLEIVHHKDHNNQNNAPENLVILSAEEHGKLHAIERGCCIYEESFCPVCSKKFTLTSNTQVFCSQVCYKISITKVYITKEELELLIWNFPYVSVGQHVGLSDNGVKKKALSLQCKMPPARFHTRNKSYQDKVRLQENIKTLSSIFEARSVNG